MPNYEVNATVRLVIAGNNPADAEEIAIEDILGGYVNATEIEIQEVKELV